MPLIKYPVVIIGTHALSWREEPPEQRTGANQEATGREHQPKARRLKGAAEGQTGRRERPQANAAARN